MQMGSQTVEWVQLEDVGPLGIWPDGNVHVTEALGALLSGFLTFGSPGNDNGGFG